MEISPDRAFAFAQAFLALTQKTVGTEPPGFPDLDQSTVRDGPTSVQDLTGPKLFYDFPLIGAEKIIGSVRIAADTAVGHPFMSIQSATPPNKAQLEQAAEAKAAVEFLGHTVKSAQLVSFNYPRVGILLVLDKAGQQIQRIFDPEFPTAPLLPVAEAGFPQNTEGEVVHPSLTNLPAGGDVFFDDASRFVDSMIRAGANRLGLKAGPDAMTFSSTERVRAIDNALANQPEGIGAPEEKILAVPLKNQERSDFCVLASIAMLLGYHKVNTPATQQEIRALLTQDPPLYVAGAGVLPENQVAAFKRCFPSNKFTIMMDTSPTWAKARDQINLNLPLKSGIFGHSRVAIGYQNTPVTTSGTGLVLERHRLLWINDPNSPQVRLELYEVETTDENDPTKTSVRQTIPIKTNYVTVAPIQ